jgi:hypothetical protein
MEPQSPHRCRTCNGIRWPGAKTHLQKPHRVMLPSSTMASGSGPVKAGTVRSHCGQWT